MPDRKLVFGWDEIQAILLSENSGNSQLKIWHTASQPQGRICTSPEFTTDLQRLVSLNEMTVLEGQNQQHYFSPLMLHRLPTSLFPQALLPNPQKSLKTELVALMIYE